MKQHRSPLSIVNRKLKEVRIKRYHFERKIRGGVGITMAGVGVEPVIRAAKCGQVFQNECFPREALLLDIELVKQLAHTHDALVTIEEGSVMGGAGSAVAEALAEAGIVKPLLHLGLPDRFIDHGDASLLLAACGLDAKGIAAAVRQRFSKDWTGFFVMCELCSAPSA